MCTLLNCSIWVIYGSPLVEYQLLVVTINAAGAILELSYIFLYVTFAPKKLQVLMYLHELIRHSALWANIFCAKFRIYDTHSFLAVSREFFEMPFSWSHSEKKKTWMLPYLDTGRANHISFMYVLYIYGNFVLIHVF